MKLANIGSHPGFHQKGPWSKIIPVFCSFLFFSPLAAEAGVYQIPVEISVPVEDTTDSGRTKAFNRLILGVHPDATENYDLQWDTPALFRTPDPDHPPVLKAYIDHPEYGPEQRQLWRDVRPEDGSEQWDITVSMAPSAIGKTVTLAWVLPSSLSASGGKVTLSDKESNRTVDMKTESSYRFTGNSVSSPKTFTVSVTSQGRSSDKSGSGAFGCGTIRLTDSSPPDAGSAGTILLECLLLLSPILLKLRRLRLPL